jgi:hypothetical protein
VTCPCCRGEFQHTPNCTIRLETDALISGHGMQPQIAAMVAGQGWLYVQRLKARYEQANGGLLPQDGGPDREE